jgi:hypothetical protein
MKVTAIITEHSPVEKIINHLKLIFSAERAHPPQLSLSQLILAAEPRMVYFL